MSELRERSYINIVAVAAVVAAFTFLYATVLAKLGRDWWSDENYSHGLLVPVVIAIMIWREWGRLKAAVTSGRVFVGGSVIFVAMIMLLAGVVGAELFTQRVSMALILVGGIIYFFGTKIINSLAVPFVLLLLAIPIPQIVFNRIALPLQTLASQIAVWGIRIFDVPTVRKGNVIDILPNGGIQSISLEVVEACSGIRSLMTLVTLALILAYFTRRGDGRFGSFSGSDLTRAIVLMLAAVPIAVLTNAARVTATGVFTYYYGKQATEGTWHDLSGWLVYVVALLLLFCANLLLKKVLKGASGPTRIFDPRTISIDLKRVSLIVAFLCLGGIAVNYFATRSEIEVPRSSLTTLSSNLGDWKQRGSEIKFSEDVENILRTSDYTMREYTDATGRISNIYVGYYATQRTGATYHSPQNCLPGAGWVLRDPQTVEITTTGGRTFKANLYTIENGLYREVMIYWYQGRGHFESSEYRDKINTVIDSVARRRTDGALVRVMTSVGSDETASLTAAKDLAARLADQLPAYVPE